MGTARQERTNTSWERCWKLEINSYVYQRVHLQGNVYQGTVKVEIEFRLIEAIFSKSSHYLGVNFLIALLFQREIWQEWCFCLTILVKRRLLCFWFQTCLSQNLIREAENFNIYRLDNISLCWYIVSTFKRDKIVAF